MSNKIFHFLILACATIFAQGCSFLEDFIDDEEYNETIETEYKLSTSDINGYDQMIYSDRVCHLYKANDNNLPHSITSFITDENNELHIIHYSFDDNGIPNYIIFDNQSIYLDNINGTTYDMTVINPDGTFFTLDNIDTGIDIASYWDNISTLTKAEPGMSYPEYAFALTKHLFGGVTMARGGIMMLMGCAMLVPGANVAVGATLMLTGGAQFLAGALLTTRATDQIVSDGSHTEGFDQMASGLSLSSAMGGLTTAGTKISSEICKFIITEVFEAGYDGTERFLREHRAECDESKEKVKDFLKETLITGDVNFLNLDSREVELSGSMTRLLSSSDRVGILLSSDTDAMYVDDYKDIDNFTSGDFKATFSDLWRDQYYYRAFYESKEYNRTFIASAKSFTFPRVETLHYDILDDNKYKIHYRVDADPAHLPTETGICLSNTEYEPTIDDISKSITISESCEESIEFTLEEPFYYYRAYVKIGDKYIYGDTHKLTSDDRENGGEFPTPGQWINLGLPSGIKWAAWNVGARCPEEYGEYYAWGETSKKSIYNLNTYKYWDSIWDEFIHIGNCISGTSYDVATVKWGNGARMPTTDEIQELLYNCEICYYEYNGVRGNLVFGPNKNSIFIPFSDLADGNEIGGDKTSAFLWSGTLEQYDDAYGLTMVRDVGALGGGIPREIGLTVRPVKY